MSKHFYVFGITENDGTTENTTTMVTSFDASVSRPAVLDKLNEFVLEWYADCYKDEMDDRVAITPWGSQVYLENYKEIPEGEFEIMQKHVHNMTSKLSMY